MNFYLIFVNFKYIMNIYIENELLNFQNIVKEISLKVILELIINFVKKIQIILNELQGLNGLKTLLNKLKVILIDKEVVQIIKKKT